MMVSMAESYHASVRMVGVSTGSFGTAGAAPRDISWARGAPEKCVNI